MLGPVPMGTTGIDREKAESLGAVARVAMRPQRPRIDPLEHPSAQTRRRMNESEHHLAALAAEESRSAQLQTLDDCLLDHQRARQHKLLVLLLPTRNRRQPFRRCEHFRKPIHRDRIDYSRGRRRFPTRHSEGRLAFF